MADNQSNEDSYPFCLAIDVGGTKLAAAIVRSDGEILGQSRSPVPNNADAEGIFQTLLATANNALLHSGVQIALVSGIGIGSAGPMVWPEGIVSPLNIRPWRDFPLRERLDQEFPGRLVRIHNDAVAIAAGEFWRGQYRKAKNLLAMTVSTGIGGGLVLDGKLFHGKTGNAGHIGHLVVDPDGPPCVCGAHGCLETIASGPASVRWALDNGWKPRSNEPPTGYVLAQDAEGGDEVAGAAVTRAGRAVGLAIASSLSLLDLDAVVIAGGFSQSGPMLWSALHTELKMRATLRFTKDVPVVPSILQGDANLLGAAAFIFLDDLADWT